MTSKEIIIKLIDSKAITGEEAYLLINDVLKAEMVAINEALGKIKTQPINIPSIWTTDNSSSSGTSYVLTSTGTSTDIK